MKILIKTTLFLLIYTVVFITTIAAQIVNPVKWSFSSSPVQNRETEIIFAAKIDKGWHLYSQYIDKGGPIPTSFNFDKSKDYQLVGKVIEPKAKSVFDDIFNMNVKYFDGKVVFKQKIKILSVKSFSVKGTFEYMTCNDGSCIPFSDNEFNITVNGGEGNSATVLPLKKTVRKLRIQFKHQSMRGKTQPLI